jgi:hypothetical protein
MRHWCPKPADDVCKMYGHVFRMVNDQRVNRELGSLRQRRPVHLSVAVPRQATMDERSQENTTTDLLDSEDSYSSGSRGDDEIMGLPQGRLVESKSAPDLLSRASTSATAATGQSLGQTRPSSFGSIGLTRPNSSAEGSLLGEGYSRAQSRSSSRGGRLSLPALKPSSANSDLSCDGLPGAIPIHHVRRRSASAIDGEL